MKLCITDIQRFCLHDGPGIRTTIFLKGCQLRCPWCCNPETQSLQEQMAIDMDNCFYPICPSRKSNAVCLAMRSIGKRIDVQECLAACLQDRKYYQADGGVTFSGGEPLLQADVLVGVMQALKKEQITICVETSLYASLKQLQLLLPYVDTWYVDLKSLEPACISKLKGNLNEYITNLNYLTAQQKHIILRIPLVKPYTFTNANLEAIKRFLPNYQFEKIELFSIHKLATKKYQVLGMTQPAYEGVSEEELQTFAQAIAQKDQVIEVMCI